MGVQGEILFLGYGDVISDELYKALRNHLFRKPVSSPRRQAEFRVCKIL
jgi:hypothetical protein